MPRFISFKRSGFTLVELLVVIAIIGVLVGLLVPAVMAARVAVQRATIKMDVDGIASAMAQYRTKYGDNPPDGSSWPEFERHIRKAFPQILTTELDLMRPTARPTHGTDWNVEVRNDSEPMNAPADLRVMEPAEAIVFFLGGFSNNPQKPFTGAGGPFLATGNSSQPWQYNPGRLNPLFDFDQGRLTVAVVGGITVSDDEARFELVDVQAPSSLRHKLDLLPMYLSRYSTIPLVYFSSKTYQSTKSGSVYYNRFYLPSRDDTCRPLKSDVLNTATSSYKYMEDKGFQLISPGLDGIHGAAPTVLLHRFPSGESDEVTPSFKRFMHAGIPTGKPSPQLDNTANFSEPRFDSGLNN